MPDEHNLDWNNVDKLSLYLFERLQHPILKATEQVYQSPRVTIQQLQLAHNRLNAYTSLVEWKTSDVFPPEAFVKLHLGDAPAWVFESLNRFASIKMEHSKPIYIHPATFYESLLLLTSIAHHVGKLSHITTADATLPQNGVWIRIVFTPPNDEQFKSKSAIKIALNNATDYDATLELDVIADMLCINHTQFALQNNTRTGHQAFSILLPANEASAIDMLAALKAEEQLPQATPSIAASPKPNVPVAFPEELIIDTDELPTVPMPTIQLHERANSLDRNDNVLTQIQDILLDYIATPTLAENPTAVLKEIQQLLESNDVSTPDAAHDRIKLARVYDVMQASPQQNSNHTDIDNESARQRLIALQQLVLEPFFPIQRDPSMNGATPQHS